MSGWSDRAHSVHLSLYLSLCLTHSGATSGQPAALIYSQQLKRDIEQVLLSEETTALFYLLGSTHSFFL